MKPPKGFIATCRSEMQHVAPYGNMIWNSNLQSQSCQHLSRFCSHFPTFQVPKTGHFLVQPDSGTHHTAGKCTTDSLLKTIIPTEQMHLGSKSTAKTSSTESPKCLQKCLLDFLEFVFFHSRNLRATYAMFRATHVSRCPRTQPAADAHEDL